MTYYCLGFMFNENKTDVLLIEKQKPAWQAGKFNGIGGKLEFYDVITSGKYGKRAPQEMEKPLDAMYREFKEETGLGFKDWRYVVTMRGADWCVYVFTAVTDQVFYCESKESEQVALLPITELDKYDYISNLSWLIPLCLDQNDNKKGINYTIINTPI